MIRPAQNPESGLADGTDRRRAQVAGRAAGRGIRLNVENIRHLEQSLWAMRPAFVVADQDLYFLTVRYARNRFVVLFDVRAGAIVTVGRARCIAGPDNPDVGP